MDRLGVDRNRRKVYRPRKSVTVEEAEGNSRSGVSVGGLIETATNSTRPEVDPRTLKAIKYAVRSSDSELRLAAQTLMSLMKRDHSQVRYLALMIIDELFMRSKLLRALIVEDMDQLLTLSVGFRRDFPLPAPPAVAFALRSKAIEFLEKWNDSFGVHYRQLRLGYDYLKNTLRYQFPNLQANAARLQQERRQREIKTKQIMLSKFEAFRTNFASMKDDIQSTTDEIRECLDLLHSEEDDMHLDLVDDDDEEMEEFRNSELRQIRLDSLKEGEKVQENSENKVIFDALRESYKVLVTKHLVAVQESISVLIRVDLADNGFRDAALKDIIDIKNHLQSVKKRCEEAGCVISEASKLEEDDIWEEGAFGSQSMVTEDSKKSPVSSSFNESKDGTSERNKNRSQKKKVSKDETSEHNNNRSQKKIILKDETFECNNKTIQKKDVSHDSRAAEGETFKDKLLTEAPMVKWGPYLDNWGSNRDFMANQRGLDLDSHWGRVDEDAAIPAGKIAELSFHASFYEEEPAEIPPCRAPLKIGGLCQRRDLKLCPFHGPVIPRDDEGNPIHSNTVKEEELSHDIASTSSSIQEPDPKLIEQLAKQAVKNVRKREEEETKRKRALKRAKLAEVREHNNAVLRDAAIASTSRSAHIGEDIETTVGHRSRSRNKKETLASMLKKKITVKDRLAQKLLNTRSTEATVRQLTMDQESNYKEAFPNQW